MFTDYQSACFLAAGVLNCEEEEAIFWFCERERERGKEEDRKIY